MLCHKESQPHTLEHDDTKSQSNIYNKSDEAHGSIRPPATKVRKLDKPGDSVFRNGNIRARLDSRSGSDSGVEGDGVQNMDESEPANGSGSVLPANELNTDETFQKYHKHLDQLLPLQLPGKLSSFKDYLEAVFPDCTNLVVEGANIHSSSTMASTYKDYRI